MTIVMRAMAPRPTRSDTRGSSASHARNSPSAGARGVRGSCRPSDTIGRPTALHLPTIAWLRPADWRLRSGPYAGAKLRRPPRIGTQSADWAAEAGHASGPRRTWWTGRQSLLSGRPQVRVLAGARWVTDRTDPAATTELPCGAIGRSCGGCRRRGSARGHAVGDRRAQHGPAPPPQPQRVLSLARVD
jgi:hypothetical protein